ncbi:MAG: hypothetical protein US52_C0016G0007 [candidate division WS6 bacterium GW2011_GWA2_37_6]|uniref:Uncharacterized protein n=1 Tax=candidate division WS6 bacterium GW2011_GWA2_37_6 TaxID=1619087 RepID=A0A0G0HB57_9BACT|nr:MAG: hypothetical protein US52_C0016G0007 [candidate division WS6 bacterium GW2011_GWA2_37_6]
MLTKNIQCAQKYYLAWGYKRVKYRSLFIIRHKLLDKQKHNMYYV